MPLQNGAMVARFFGVTPQAQLADKIAQMRRDLNHIQHALNAIDRSARANVSPDDMKPDFAILYDWYLSAMESFYAMVWATYDRDKVDAVIKDFESKFERFTSMRSIVLGSRPRS